MFRAGRIEDAEKTASLFTKDGDKDQLTTLVEMQCMWYEVEGGRAHILRKDYGKVDTHNLNVYPGTFTPYFRLPEEIEGRSFQHTFGFNSKTERAVLLG